MSETKMLTTIDNPFNPFTHWDEWLSFDLSKGYGTCEYLDRMTVSSDSLSEEEQKQFLNQAMKTICEMETIYRMVGPSDTIVPINLDTVEGLSLIHI